jgi:two-component system KDP operon response regulator KdpE
MTMLPLPTKLRVLIVDAEPANLHMLCLALEPADFVITRASRGYAALDAVRRNETDLVLLDLALPDIDGLQVIKRIRYAGSLVPIIVMSSRVDEASKVTALDLGADDYVTKPFGIDELLARIRVLQRYRVQAPPPEAALEAGSVRINTGSRSVTIRGIETKLSPREYDLLRLLTVHAGKVLTHGFIIRNVWGSGNDIQYLRIYVSALRRKIELNPEQPTLLLTEQGVGYRLSVAEPDVLTYERPRFSAPVQDFSEISSL